MMNLSELPQPSYLSEEETVPDEDAINSQDQKGLLKEKAVFFLPVEKLDLSELRKSTDSSEDWPGEEEIKRFWKLRQEIVEHEQAEVLENQLLAMELPPNLRAALNMKEKEHSSPRHVLSVGHPRVSVHRRGCDCRRKRPSIRSVLPALVPSQLAGLPPRRPQESRAVAIREHWEKQVVMEQRRRSFLRKGMRCRRAHRDSSLLPRLVGRVAGCGGFGLPPRSLAGACPHGRLCPPAPPTTCLHCALGPGRLSSMDCIHSTPVPLSFWLGLASGGPQQEVGEEVEREGRVFIPPMPPCESAWVPPPGAWGGCSPCPSPGPLLCPWGPSATAHVNKPPPVASKIPFATDVIDEKMPVNLSGKMRPSKEKSSRASKDKSAFRAGHLEENLKQHIQKVHKCRRGLQGTEPLEIRQAAQDLEIARKLQGEVRKLRLGLSWTRSRQLTALAGHLPLHAPASRPWDTLFNMK
ncbi:leucine-rich repeat-containing protein 27-like [Leptonychotes weddellii]|uniref:Leucine-rich repeat-containing protein 27-like n=1 Tax=Leptonychotes weddellii TaxID=9713 RepID=A0A7F8QN81_LEPWE|nr:leucine-rich repeat-containing protein 27-like [Leptonychotes weddellii]